MGRLGLVVTAVITVLAGTIPVSAAGSPTIMAPQGSGLLQYTSGGHVLAFSEEGVAIASAIHMVRTEYVDANAVAPWAEDSEVNAGTEGEAEPLGAVHYPELWSGVDLVYEADEGAIAKSTYYVDDGSVVESIRPRYSRPVTLDDQGNLLIAFDTGIMVESPSVAWQEVSGDEVRGAASHNVFCELELGFALGDYVSGAPVSTDPWHTFLPDSNNAVNVGIAVDGDGDVFVAGSSPNTWGSPVRPYTPDCSNAFVAKLNSSGELQWNTFLGGGGSHLGYGIAVDGEGNAYLTGWSTLAWGDDPVRAHTGIIDAFVAKLNSSGELQWHTFLGSSGFDRGYGIAVDGSGNAYVTGMSSATWGSPVRAYDWDTDVFVAKLDNDGALQWNTFLGGSDTDEVGGIAVDGEGFVYVTGHSLATWGDDPVRAYTAGYDAFVAKLNNSGALQWNTFLGGITTDRGHGIAVDGAGTVYVTGWSLDPWGLPLEAHAGGWDAFAAKLGNDGTLQWNTFIGGAGFDAGHDIAVDVGGNIYLTGYSDATWGDDPVRAYTSGDDAFVAKLNNSGAPQWHTFLGGVGTHRGHGIAVDDAGSVYVRGYSSSAWGSPVPTCSSGNALVAKLDSSGRVEPDKTIEIAAIPGVVAPVVGETPVAEITETDQYTGTVSWEPSHATFQPDIEYTATITLEPKAGFTLVGVATDFFTIDGATTTTNDEDSGVVEAGFPATDKTIDIAAIPGVTAPVVGETHVAEITETDQYTGTVSWEPSHATFQPDIEYTATITLEPKAGFTLVGVATYFFTVDGATTTTNDEDSGVVEAGFPAQHVMELRLHQGWNMVSVPLQLAAESNSPSQVFPGAVAVHTWDGDTKSYIEPDTIVPELGYWVAMEADDTITATGVLVIEWTADLKAGWNLIGSVSETRSVDDLLPHAGDPLRTSEVYWWNSETQAYDNVSTIIPGQGYWLASTNDCTVTLGPPEPT